MHEPHDESVPKADFERQRALKHIYQRCLVDIAKRMNAMADEIDRENQGAWAEATRPAPLDEKGA